MATRQIRPIRVEGNIAFVPLTKGYEAIIDAADVPLVDGFKWTASVRPRAVYAVRKQLLEGKKRNVRLHRWLLGEPDGLEVDHIDGDGLHNRRNNLRIVTSQQNNHNQRMSKNNTSGFKGVGWNKSRRKWRARIKCNGKTFHLGLFQTPEEAHAAYTEASERLHGAFGRTC